MLFTFPSRYLSTIGLGRVFSLGGWARRIHAGFHVPRATQDPSRLQSAPRTGLSPSLVRLSRRFRSPLSCHLWSYNPSGTGIPLVWAVPRSLAATGGITFCFLFLWVLRCFSSPGSPPPPGWMTVRQTAGLPHSGTPGSKTACVSPGLFAACRALHRLPEPQASAVRPFLLSPAPCHEGTGRIPWNCSINFLSELGIYSVFSSVPTCQ